MNYLGKRIVGLLLGALTLATTGCASMYADPDLIAYSANKVVRRTVFWAETKEHSWTPAFYDVEAARHNWTPEDNQYRWIISVARFRKDVSGYSIRYVRVPDQVPRLERGDLVDVYEVDWYKTDYGNFNAGYVVRLVCRHDDRPCIDASKRELGGLNEIVKEGKPGTPELTFTKIYDTEGRPPKPQ